MLRWSCGVKFTLVFMMFFVPGRSQTKEIDSLNQLLSVYKNDTNRVVVLNNLVYHYMEKDVRAAIRNAHEAISLSEKLNFIPGLYVAHFNLGSIHNDNLALCIDYFEKAYHYAEISNRISGKINSLNEIALAYSSKGKNSDAIIYIKKAIVIAREHKKITELIKAYWFLGSFHNLSSNYESAIQVLLEASEIALKNNNQVYLGNVYLTLGLVHSNMQDNEESIVYYKKALEFFKQKNNDGQCGLTLNNIAVSYTKLKRYEEAINYSLKALTYLNGYDSKRNKSYAFTNIGSALMKLEKYEEALSYFLQALEIRIALNESRALIICYTKIGQTYDKMGDYANAQIYLNMGLELAEKTDLKKEKLDVYFSLAELYHNTTDYQKAFDYMKRYDLLKDSVFNEQKSKQIADMTTKYDTEKKQQEIEILTKDKSLQESMLIRQQLMAEQQDNEILLLNESKKLQQLKIKQKETVLDKQHALMREKKKQLQLVEQQNTLKDNDLKRQRTVIFTISLCGILILLLGLLVFKGYRHKAKSFLLLKKQKSIIESQKHLVEEKNKEILDSITYAKRIQSAILPQSKLVKQYFKDSFILYKPKDIVAGDFYWFEVIDDTIYFAAADCTGHGVPGAMVSVVCHNALNRSVKEYNLKSPGEILDKTREIVIAEFEKSDEDVKDGMDISLGALRLSPRSVSHSHSHSRSHSVLEWAGAHNPLWILRNNEIIEIKADKQPIGKFAFGKPFTNHEIKLEVNDVIYIFTDGYQDQFGGEKQKKFKVAQMRELFLSLTYKSMEQQHTIIDEIFENWKANLEQVDDVCVIGIKI